MTALLIILVAIVLLVIGYVTYGSWLCKQWGIDPTRKTPAVEMEDGVDYVAAPAPVLMGHHFSSIAGAGPINGPIQACVFGWLPVFLWCVIGGIFFGGLQDFGSLFASIRHGGKSVGEIIGDSMGQRSKKLFLIFGLLVLILVIASFVNVVAGTFYTDGATFAIVTNPTGNQTTAMISLLFIVMAVIYGFATTRAGLKVIPASICGVIGIVLIVALGMNVGISMGRTPWIILIGIYLVVASLLPVWVLLQPRDYLSSFLLYAMMAVALVGIIASACTGNTSFDIPMVTGWSTNIGYMFPALFVTVACGACSGFHSLIATGTSSKQLSSEKDAKAIGYGSMLIESALGIVALIAVGVVYNQYIAGEFGSPAAAFAAGIGSMFGTSDTVAYATIYSLLTLAVSVFALTSLDTGTRLSRFMFTELFLKKEEATWKDASGIRKCLAHPMFGTSVMVIIGCVLGGLKLSAIWGLFGAANQLLAGIALMAVAAWLGDVGKNNKMFIIPTIFMLAATLTYLAQKVQSLANTISSGAATWGEWFQIILAIAMFCLAIFLVVEGIITFSKQSKKKAAA